jgi:O-antigen ligase
MIENYKSKTSEIILLIVAAAATSIVFVDFLWMAVLALIFLIILFRYQKNFFIIFSFFTLITITTGLSASLRLLVQLVNIFLLFYFFLRIYQIDLRNYPKIPRSITLLVLLIFSSMIVSTFFSDYPETGLVQILRTSLFFLMVYLFYSLIENERELKLYILVLVITAISLFFLVLYLFYSANFDVIEFQQYLFIDEDKNYIHKNTIGALFVMTISIIHAYYFSQSNSTRKRIIALTIFLLVIGLVITNARAAIFSLIVSTSFIFYFLNKKAFYRILFGIVIIIPVLFIEPINDVIQLYFRLDRIFTGRDVILEATYQIIADNPIFGTGPAAAKIEMGKNIPFMIGSSDWFFLNRHIDSIGMGHAHNFYLFFLSELGILGFITSLTIPLVFFKFGYNTLKKIQDPENKYYSIVVGLNAAGLAVFTRGLFEWGGIVSYGMIASDLPFWWCFISLIYINKRISSINNES